MVSPSYSDILFYFYTNELKFSPNLMGRLKLVYGIASVFGIWTYNKYLRNIGFKKIIWCTTFLSIGFNMLTIILVSRFNIKLGIPDFFFCMTADALTTALAEINTLPLLVLACNICPKNIEGTLYAFLMSVINLGSLFSNQFGSLLTSYLGITATNFNNLSTLIFIANIVLLFPMPSLYLVDESKYVKEENKSEENKRIENKSEENEGHQRKKCIDVKNPTEENSHFLKKVLYKNCGNAYINYHRIDECSRISADGLEEIKIDNSLKKGKNSRKKDCNYLNIEYDV